MANAFPKLGRIFERKYRLKSVIGQGGFARIYHAEQTDLARPVALKVLDPRLSRDETREKVTVERFRREARLVAGLRDPHTITLHDHGQTEEGLFYLVFEYVDGKSLTEVLEESGAIEPERVVKILKQTLMSLQEAHAQGVLHRDIKPGNIMLFEHMGRPDQVKVLDFGIAKAVLSDDDGTTAQDLTKSDAIIGTPRYMAPEQFRSVSPEPASDLYSLGLVAYELLVGEAAIKADSLVNVIAEHVSGEAIRLPEEAPLPPKLRSIVDGMLRPVLGDRFGSAAEVLERLESLDEEDLSKLEPAVPPSPTELETPGEAAPVETEGSSSRRGILVGVGIGAAVAAALGAYLLGTSPTPGEDVEARPTVVSDGERPDHISIDTVPENASLKINGVFVGKSPVKVPTAEVEFPVVLSATTPEGRSSELSLERPRRSVTLRLAATDAGVEGRETGARAERNAESPAADEKEPSSPGERAPAEDREAGDRGSPAGAGSEPGAGGGRRPADRTESGMESTATADHGSGGDEGGGEATSDPETSGPATGSETAATDRTESVGASAGEPDDTDGDGAEREATSRSEESPSGSGGSRSDEGNDDSTFIDLTEVEEK